VSVKPEHASSPGATWQTQVATSELLTTDAEFDNTRAPKPNRATRRAQKRAARKQHR
jgi:hypothetical protein